MSATTHWRYAGLLQSRFPRVRVDAGVLYVDNGQIITSAGTAAGIDACLHLVRADHGAASPARPAGQRRGPRQGRPPVCAPVQPAVRAATGSSPGRWLIRQRIDASLPLLEQGQHGIEEVGRMVGFASPAAFRRHFRRILGVSPSTYRQRFTSPQRPGVPLEWLPVTGRDLSQVVEAGWAATLAPAAERITAMGGFLRAELAAGRRYLPAGENVLRAFGQPFADVRVLIMGQDPYPTPGHAVGLSFSVPPGVRPLPPSLVNIFREYTADLGYPTPADGDLSPWTERGVLLLNRVLTVQPGRPGSHRGKGWEEVTEQAIQALAARDTPLVAIMWGRDARSLAPLLGKVPLIESAHPSPYSADRGFFGSRPFSRASLLLEQQGGEPVDWKLP